MLLDLIKIDLSLGLLLFIPGYAVLIALMKNKNPLGTLGTLVVSFVLSLSLLNFGLILVDKIGLKINLLSILLTVLIISSAGFLVFLFSTKKSLPKSSQEKNNWTVFLLILVLAIFIRAAHLAPKIIPHTTDLGHHMYWANYIIQFQELPNYGIPDFIIGEHILFGAASILTGIGAITALPTIILFIINIFSLLAVFLLTKEIALLFLSKNASHKVALFSLIAIGIFYSIASPQANYINGGVIGNLLGNLIVPTILFLFLKAYREKNVILPCLGFFLTALLTYTHHLSTFVFIYSLLGFAGILLLIFLATKLVFKKKNLSLSSFIKIFLNLKTALTGLLILAFVFLVRIPSYLNVSAIDTAVGSPSKSTRFGLSINNLIHSTGPWRFFYSLVAIVFLSAVLFFIIKKKNYLKKIYQIQNNDLLGFLIAFSLATGWFITIFIMSHWPALLKIDIISGRIANYLTYPSAVLAGFGVYAILQPAFQKSTKTVKLIIFSIIFIPGVISGLFDFSESYPEKTEKIQQTVHTFAGSTFLAEKTSLEEKILKDHIYLTGDTWIKNFLMRGYEEPLSRTFLRKYEDPVKPRETCTRDMIATPDSETGEKCFEETGVRFIILKKNFDTNQFEKSEKFSKIFNTGEVIIFERSHE